MPDDIPMIKYSILIITDEDDDDDKEIVCGFVVVIFRHKYC